ncbi:MAG: hypothetical protein NC090_00450 [Anaeroplasma bactoclasticum]|nr:hypothetical protein [Staphylococcus sp.]MCM1350628.1 hypothetical protein [Prevotella sp.]MCM1513452.1 hypothetical protein [Anaeroplasma bactoclasticum]
MEKTNELNKFLSYVHMGNSIYRIYYDEAQRLKEEKLSRLIVEIMEMFKKHEEGIRSLIQEFNEEPTSSLTAAGIMGVYKEKMKVFHDAFTICINAIKSTNMGLISALKFLEENKELATGLKDKIMEVIDDYGVIIHKVKGFILEECIK